MSVKRGIKDDTEISLVSGVSVNLVRHNKEILQESKGNKIRQEKLGFIWKMRERGVKKTKTSITGSLAGLMTGGYR